jgi:MFS family permease
MQGIFQGCYFGGGYGLGSLVGGLLSEHVTHGIAPMFVVAAGLMTVVWAAIAALRTWAARHNNDARGSGGDGLSAVYQPLGPTEDEDGMA